MKKRIYLTNENDLKFLSSLWISKQEIRDNNIITTK